MLKWMRIILYSIVYRRLIKPILAKFHLELKKIRNQDSRIFFEKFLSSENIDCVLYVGANVGQYVEGYLRSFPTADLILYEPDPDLFRKLVKKFGDNPRINLKQQAVSSLNGREFLHRTSLLTNGRMSSSLLRMAPRHTEWSEGSEQKDKVEVETVYLDAEDYSKYSKILLKLDIQGMELQALRGAQKLLGTKINAVDTEVSFQQLYFGESHWLEVVEYLNSLGFYVFGLDPWGIDSMASGELMQADIQFVRGKSRNFLNRSEI